MAFAEKCNQLSSRQLHLKSNISTLSSLQINHQSLNQHGFKPTALSHYFLFLPELTPGVCEMFAVVMAHILSFIPKQIVCFITCCILFLNMYGQNIAFNHLTVEHGLSNNSILSIAQDRQGFMWYGTNNGLNRYDGHRFRVYKMNREDSSSISNDNILSLFSDASGTLWIGTSNGLNKYVPEKDAFVRVPLKVKGVARNYNSIHCLYEDKKRNLWIGTQNGLYLLTDRNQLSFQNFLAGSQVNNGIAGNTIRSIFEDHNGHLWIGTNTGLTKMKWANGQYQFETFRHDPKNPNSLSANYITTIAEDVRQNLWIGTQNSGVNLYNPATGSFAHFLQSTQPSGIVNNNIRKIISDRAGKIWVGTQEGLSIINPVSKSINSYQHDAGNKKSLSQNSIHSIFPDANGSVWIGTYFGGVNIIYSYTTSFSTLQNRDNRFSISNNVVSSVVEDDQHNLWIGTEGGGLNYYNRNTGLFTVYKNKQHEASSLGSNLVKVVYKDKEGNIWAGTHGGGLNLFEPGSKTFKRFLYKDNDPETLNSEVVSMLEDSYGRFWVGSTSGLLLFRSNKGQLESFGNAALKGPTISGLAKALIEDSKKRIWIGTASGLFILEHNTIRQINSNYNINCIKEDKSGNIWLGLHQAGLAMYDIKKGTFSHFTEKQGLSNNNVMGILEDEKGNLWLSTDFGLVKFSPSQKSFQTYTVSDGLAGNEFNYNSFFKDSKGEFFFGGYNGLTSFFPGAIETNKYTAPVVFTGLKLFNTPVQINGKDNLLKENINVT
jgi:ligand-binding sensor domain-containing protein